MFVCSRCFGIYLGAILYAVAAMTGLLDLSGLMIGLMVTALPIPAFVDWGRYALARATGTNLTRVVSGGLLGIAYVLVVCAVVGGTGRTTAVCASLGWFAVYRVVAQRALQSPSASVRG